ncbi:prepilin peptidase [Brevibacillus fluminis]|uniref:Prepilin peptidase n=1 Tax=Brevibacillus fluminis TaxID=511487 RepID=A0A3M8D507_9BACL|nr:A24 family peptidase [Brevibacillus fluminis]RNB82799.1 prepilin peptidase [Brevibacillus fluminis]
MGVYLGVFLAIAAFFDWKWRKLPNWFLLPVMLAGLAYQMAEGTWWTAAGGLASGFAITVVPVAMRAMGMGDQKLLMAVGAWTSTADVYWLVVLSAFLCIVVVLCRPQRIRRLGRHLYLAVMGLAAHRRLWLPDIQQSALTVPFAVYVCGAFWIRQAAGIWL